MGGNGTSDTARCKGTRADGTPCQSPFVTDDGWCPAHGPNGQRRMSQRGRRGAQKTNATRKGIRVVPEEDAPPPPKSLEDAVEWASWAVWATTTGKLDARTGHEAGYILRAFLDGKKHLERTDERVKALEAKIRKLRKATEEAVS